MANDNELNFTAAGLTTTQWHEGADASGGLGLRREVRASSKILGTKSSISRRPRLVTGMGSPRHKVGSNRWDRRRRFRVLVLGMWMAFTFFAEKFGFGEVR